VLLSLPIETTTVPSIVAEVNAADWHEREVEDMFGIHFEGHPRLGDFILHDQIWREGIEPMRKTFSATQPASGRQLDLEWEPLLIVGDPGSFAMPVGPVYDGGLGESLHFLLETVGEDVIRALPRLFYNYRAVEKIAEGRCVSDVLLLAERFAATSAFAHSLAFCQAVEKIHSVEVPPRAAIFRVLICELERLRHHAGAIAAIGSVHGTRRHHRGGVVARLLCLYRTSLSLRTKRSGRIEPRLWGGGMQNPPPINRQGGKGSAHP